MLLITRYIPTDPEVVPTSPAGIVAILSADACGVDASNATEIYIGNNTIAGKQTWGIYVSGVKDPNEAGTVIIANNLIAGSRHTAIYLVNGWMRSLVICNGFYLNSSNMNVPGGGSLGEYVRDSNAVIVEDFNSYPDSEALREVWKDGSTNGTGAEVFLANSSTDPSLGGPPYQSMRYKYKNNTSDKCYYSKAEATTDLPSGIGSDWTIGDANTLTLYFYGQADNDIGEQMYVELTDGDEDDFYVVDNFDSYGSSSEDLRKVWKDGSTNGTRAEVFVAEPNCKRPSWSMRYRYTNHFSPYYAKAEATIGTATSGGKPIELNIDPNWLGLGAQTLSLWFYGTATNDANQQMYIKLVDNDNPAHTATVEYRDYGDMNDIREEKWHQWNIPLTDFTSVNMADVNKIIIGFGDGTQAENDGIEDYVYFEDIRLYTEYPPLTRQHTAKVAYNGIPYRLMEDWWHVWNIPFTEFNGVNLANIKSIAIGFGDGNAPYSYTGVGTVYFDEIILGQGNAEEPFYDGAVELEEDEDPFVFGYDWYPLFLRQDCPLIDAGCGYIDEYPYLIGKTTDFNGVPDCNIADIGFHYFNWYYVNAGEGDALMADLHQDRIVNFKDFAILAAGWLTTYDINDLITMTNEWLMTASENPPIAITASGDANDGLAEVGASGYFPDTQRIFLLADGQYAGEILWFREGEPLRFDVSALGPGTHQLKAIGVDAEGSITCSNLQESEFNCPLNYCYCVDAYESNEPHNFCAYYQGTGSVNVKVYDEGNNIIWSQAYSAQNLNGVIPPEITSRDDLDLIVFEPSEGGGMAIVKPLAIGFNPKKMEPNIRALLILPDWWINLNNDVDNAVRDALEFHSVQYYELKGSNATYENLSWFAHNRYIRYIYYAGHGGYGKVWNEEKQEFDEYFGKGIRRTEIGLADCRVVSVKNSDFPAGTAPSWCVPLKGERSYRSIYELKEFLPGELKLVQLDCCFSGRLRLSSTQLIEDPAEPHGEIPDSDMSWAFNMAGTDTYGQFCQGWWDKADRMPLDGKSNYEIFGILEWTNLKDGDNLDKALDDTLSDPNVHYHESGNNFRIYGRGLLTGVKIED